MYNSRNGDTMQDTQTRLQRCKRSKSWYRKWQLREAVEGTALRANEMSLKKKLTAFEKQANQRRWGRSRMSYTKMNSKSQSIWVQRRKETKLDVPGGCQCAPAVVWASTIFLRVAFFCLALKDYEGVCGIWWQRVHTQESRPERIKSSKVSCSSTTST